MTEFNENLSKRITSIRFILVSLVVIIQNNVKQVKLVGYTEQYQIQFFQKTYSN